MSNLSLNETVDKNGQVIRLWMKSDADQKMALARAANDFMTQVSSSSSQGGPRTTGEA